jgi:hypothetical protein
MVVSVGLEEDAYQCKPWRMIVSNSTLLPSPPEGWFVYKYYLLSGGSLAVIWTDRDINSDYRAWWSRIPESGPSQGMPDFWNGAAKLVLIAETSVSDPISIPLVRHPLFDCFPDGRWLIVTTRTNAGEDNAWIFQEDGQPIRSLVLGDGIKHIRCAQDGTIWVGYFDEGIFGGSLGSGGLVQFDDFGHPLWSYNDPSGGRQSCIDDCYALSLDGDEIWTCFYSDFPIVRVKGGLETLWTNKVIGSRALAIDGSFVLLAGGYKEDANRLALLKLEQGEAKLMGAFQCPEIENADLLSGHSSVIHSVKDDRWTRISVSDVRSAP